MLKSKALTQIAFMAATLGLASPSLARTTFENFGGEYINFTLEERRACDEGFLDSWGAGCLRELAKYPVSNDAATACKSLITAQGQARCLSAFKDIQRAFAGRLCTSSAKEGTSDQEKLQCLQELATKSTADDDLSQCLTAYPSQDYSPLFFVGCLPSKSASETIPVAPKATTVHGSAEIARIQQASDALPSLRETRIRITASTATCEYSQDLREVDGQKYLIVFAAGTCAGRISLTLGDFTFEKAFSQ